MSEAYSGNSHYSRISKMVRGKLLSEDDLTEGVP